MLVSGALLLVGPVGTGLLQPAAGQADPLAATPGVACDPGSRPERLQGFVEPQARQAGDMRNSYTCNVKQVAHLPGGGGFRVERYVDKAGNVCAFYDST